MFFGDGNDSVAHNGIYVSVPAFMDGGNGHDRLNGGNRDDVLDGGSGNDRLRGHGDMGAATS
jgi:Ca2+-binding RTX toxin-like protein